MPTRFRHAVRLVLLLLALFSFTNAARADELLADNSFRAALDKHTGRSWQGVPIRDALQELMKSTHVSILLDRRIDPSTELTLFAEPQPLRSLINAAARDTNADSTAVGNVVYVAPPAMCSALKRLVEQRDRELDQLTTDKSKGSKNPWLKQRAALGKKHTLAWEDLDSPRDVLQQLAGKWSIKLAEVQRLPHDLWAAGQLPRMSLVESLSVLLLPFDQTFEFVPDQLAIRIAPIPNELLAQASLASSEKPETPRSPANDVKTSRTSPRPNVTKPVDLRTRRFSFKVRNAPAKDVLESLRQQGIAIVADEKEFADADKPLDKKIDLELSNQTAERIGREIARILNCEINISNNTITLSPKR